jgi:hypothetical protein
VILGHNKGEKRAKRSGDLYREEDMDEDIANGRQKKHIKTYQPLDLLDETKSQGGWPED